MVFFWTGVGNAAKVATIGSGLKAAFDSYQALGSPDTFLQKAGKKLDKVKSRLQELTPQQREEIEQNVVPGDGPHKSIDDLEVQLQELRDMHCRLLKWYDDASIVDRHSPFTQFRYRLVAFQNDVKDLFNDTMNTTVPDVGNLLFTASGQSGQATPSSPDMSPTDSQLPPGAWVIEMTPIGGQGITTFEQPGQATPSSPDVSPTDSQLPPTAWVIEMTPVGDQGIV